MTLPNEFVVFDTEYTTWEGALERKWSGPGEFREIVQIGAIVLGPDLLEKESLLLYAKPQQNPILSDYFTTLTGISQATVDREGLSYPEALGRFNTFTRGLPIFCWGSDVEVMAENAVLVGIPFPFDRTAPSDIRGYFLERGIEASTYQSSTIPKAFGEEPPPHAHDALNDARSIAQALRALVGTTKS
jgi:inhibitor of KinA sporulation pathway (predicted exonuclease)